MEKTQTERLLTVTEKARELGISTETLRLWRQQGVGPQYVEYSGTIRYWAERPPERKTG